MTRRYRPRARIARMPDQASSQQASSIQATPVATSQTTDYAERNGLPAAPVRKALGNRALARQVIQRVPERQGKATRVPAASIQRKLTGSWDSISNIGHPRLRPETWTDILSQLKAYEDKEVELVMIENFLQGQEGTSDTGLANELQLLKADLMERLRMLIQLAQTWLANNQGVNQAADRLAHKWGEDVEQRQLELDINENRRAIHQATNPGTEIDPNRLMNVRPEMSIGQATERFVKDPVQQVLLQRMMALNLLLPRLHLEFNDLMTGRHAMTSVNTDENATGFTNRQARGGLNALDTVRYGSRGNQFFKEDTGVDPNGLINPAVKLIGTPLVNPQFGARSVAFSRLDSMLSQLFSRIEGANTRGLVVQTEFATHVRGRGEAPKMGIIMEDASGPNRTGRSANEVMDMQLQQDNRVISASDPILQRSLVRLQMLDTICGQIDRHSGNYYIHTDASGAVTGVVGIDNDLAFGATHHDITETRKQYMGLPPIIDQNYRLAILELQPDSISEALTGVLGQGELQALLTRLRMVQEQLKNMPTGKIRAQSEYDDESATALRGSGTYFSRFQWNIVRERYVRAMGQAGVSPDIARGSATATLEKLMKLGMTEEQIVRDLIPIVAAFHRARPITDNGWFLRNAERTATVDVPLMRLLQTLPGVGGANWLADVLPLLQASGTTLEAVRSVMNSIAEEMQEATPGSAQELAQMIQLAISSQSFSGPGNRRQHQRGQQNDAPVGRGRFVIGGNRNVN